MRRGPAAVVLVLLLGALLGSAACAAVLGIEGTTVDPTIDRDGGSVVLESGGPPPDSGTLTPETDGGDDAAVDAGPGCNPTKPFNPPRPINELNTGVVDIGARLSEDELTVYVGRGMNILRGTRMKIGDPFGVQTPFEVDNINGATSGHFTTPSDGVRGYFASSGRPDSDAIDIYTTSRLNLVSPWVAPTRAVGIPTNKQEDHPYIRNDGKAIYWDSNDNGLDIWRGDVLANGVVINASVVPSLKTAANESSPVVTADDLTIYFSRGPGLDVQVATRKLPTDPWGVALPVAELNSTKGERVNWISPDGCRIILYSERTGAGDLYVTEKPK